MAHRARIHHHRPRRAGGSSAVETAAVEAGDAALVSALLRKSEEMKVHPAVAFATVGTVAFGAALLAIRWPAHHADAPRGRSH